MFFRLLFLLTFIPFIEIYFLLQVNDAIGFGNTLLVILGTGFIGASLLRQQGHSILMELQKSTQQNQLPSDAIAKGFMTFIGGVLLLTPGILTDGIGLSLILPGTQQLWKAYFKRQWQAGVASGSVQFYSAGNFLKGPSPFQDRPQEPRPRRFDPQVIDIEANSSETVDKKEE